MLIATQQFSKYCNCDYIYPTNFSNLLLLLECFAIKIPFIYFYHMKRTSFLNDESLYILLNNIELVLKAHTLFSRNSFELTQTV